MAARISRSPCHRSKCVFLLLISLACQQSGNLVCASAIRAEQHVSANGGDLKNQGPQTLFSLPDTSPLPSPPLSSPAVSKLDLQKAGSLTVASPAVLSEQTIEAGRVAQVTAVSSSVGDHTERVAPTRPSAEREDVSPLGEHDGAKYNNGSLLMQDDHLQKNRTSFSDKKTADDLASNANLRTDSEKRDLVNGQARKHSHVKSGVSLISKSDKNVGKKNEKFVSPFPDTLSSEIINDLHFKDPITNPAINHEANFSNAHARHLLNQTGDQLNIPSYSPNVFKPITSQEELRVGKDEEDSPRLKRDKIPESDAYISNKLLKHGNSDDQEPGTINISSTLQYKENYSLGVKDATRKQYVPRETTVYSKFTTPNPMDFKNSTDLENQLQQSYNISREIELVHSHQKSRMPAPKSSLLNRVMGKSNEEENNQTLFANENNDTFGKPVQSTGIPMDLPETTPRERSYKQGDLESTSEVDLSDQGFSAAQQGVPLSAPASLERPNRLEHNNSLAPDTDLDLNQSRVTDDLSDIKTTGVYVQASINDIHMKNTELENVNFERNHMRSTISDENGNQNIKQKSHKEEIYIMPSSHFQNEGFALLDVKVESSVTNGMRGPVSHSSPRSEIFPNGSGESRLGPPRVKHTNVEGVITVARDAGGTALLKGVNNVALRERVDGAAFHDSFDYSALPEGVDRTSLPESVVRIAFSEAVDDIALPGGFNDIAVPEAIDNITLPKGGWGVNIPGDTDGINLPEVVDSIALPERVDGLTFPESANSIPLLGNIGQPEQYLDTSQWSNWDSFKPQMDLMTDIRELQTLLEGMSEIAHNTGEELGGLSRTKASVPKETNSESTARIHRDPRIFSDDLPADRGADAFPTYLGDRSNISSETNQTLLPLPVHGLSLGKTVYDTDIETEHFINVGNVNMVASVSHQNIGTPESNDSSQQSEDTNFKRLQRESAMSNPDINNLVSNNSQLIVPKVQEIPDKQPKILLPVSRLYPVPMMYPVSDLPKNSYLSKSSSRPPPSPPKPVSSPRPDFNIKTPGANYILSQSQPLASRLHAVEQLTAGKQFDGRDSIIAKLDVIMKELVKKMNLTQDINTTIGENRNLTETPSTPVISTDKILGPYASIARRESGDIDMIEDDFYGSADPDLYQTDLSDDIERNTRLLKQLSKKLSQTPALNSESTSATRQSPLSADDRRYSLKDQNKLLLPNDVPEFKLKSLGSMSHQSKGNLVNESGREKHFKYFSGYDLRSTPSLGESLPNNSDISPEKQKSISTHVKSRDDNSDVESDQDRTDLAHIADSKDTTIATSHADATPNTDDQHGKVSTTGKERIEHLENEKGKLDLNVHGDVSEKALHRTDIRGYGGDATPISIYESNISNEKNIADKGVFGSDGTEQQLSPFYQNDLPPGFKPTFVDNKEYAQKGNVRTYSMSDMIPGGFSSHGDFGLHDEVNQHLESQEGSLELDRNSFSNKYAEWQELRSHNPGSDPEDALEVEHLIPREDPRSGSYLGKVQPFFNKDSHHQGYGQKMWSVSDASQNKDSAAEAYFEPEEDVFHYQNDQIEDLYPSSIYDSSNLYKEYDPTTWDRGDSDISNFKSFYSGLQDTSSGMESFKFGEGDAFLFPDGNMDIAPDGYKPLSKKDINHVDHLEFSNANELPRLIKAEIWTDKQNVPSRPGIPLESLDVPEISPYKAQVLDFSLRQAAPTEGDPSSNKDPLVKDSGGEKFLFNILPTVATNTNTNISFANEAFGNISMSSSNNNMTELAPLLSPLAAFPTVRTRAAMSAVLTTHFGPTKDRMVPFDLELLDLGDNYDNTSGTFICTVPGTYVISLHLMAHPGAKVNARVHVNSRPIAALWADDNGGAGFYPSSSTHTLSHLDFGDQVYVMLVDAGYGESWVHANYNGFSVYLLYEDPL
ncbi:hypothetical protein EGW08_021627, partial [Elysia chlorotica]